MTSTEVVPEVDIEELVGEEKKCECKTFPEGFEGEPKICSNPAAWIFIYRCCGGQSLACEQHYQKYTRGWWSSIRCRACLRIVRQHEGGQLSDLISAMHRV